MKKMAIKGLVALAAVVALCMFFSGTIKTISTAKVRLVTAKQGKLEEEIKLSGNLTFTQTEEVKLALASDQSVTIKRVRVAKGRKVAALWVPCGLGDPVVGLEVPATEETLTRILGERRQVTRMTRLPDGAEVLAVMGLDGLPVSASSPHRRIAAEFAPETGGLAATRNVLVMARTSDGRACDLPAELARAMMDRGIAIGANDGINH